MAYQQPNVDKYAINGYSFFRMKQELASPGDIFESQQGAHAFALGPDSDISQVNVAYLDEQVPNTFLNQLTISPQRTFVNLLTAFNKTKSYAPSQVPARLLIWPAEIFDPTFLPFGFSEANEAFVFEPPVIDIIQLFEPTQSLIAQRTDKTFYYEELPPPPGGQGNSTFVAVPYYGRRYASIMVANNADSVPAEGVRITVRGINFRIKETVPGTSRSSSAMVLISSTLHDTLVTGGQAVSWVVRSDYDSRQAEIPPFTLDSNAGLFDYLLIELEMVGAAEPFNNALRVVVSDIVG